jgi:hypothetical protein
VNSNRNGFIFADPTLADLVADSDTELPEVIFGTGFGGITDLKVALEGSLYVLSFSLCKIFAIARRQIADFNDDGISDSIIFREGAWLPFDFDTGSFLPGESVWTGIPTSGCVPMPMDYDGDGVLDRTLFCNGADEVVVYRGGACLFFNFATGAFDSTKSQWTGGGAGCIPAPMDYDGDGAADLHTAL